MARMTGGGALVEMLTRRGGRHAVRAARRAERRAVRRAVRCRREAAGDLTRHEQAAAYMAFGYAAASGRPGAFAWCRDRACSTPRRRSPPPMHQFAGAVHLRPDPVNLIGRGFGLLHEMPDQLDPARPDEMGGAHRPPERDRQAGQRGVRADGDGPAAPGRARDAARHHGAGGVVAAERCRAPARRRRARSRALDEAAALLAGAKQPMIFVSGCAEGAGAEVLDVAEKLGRRSSPAGGPGRDGRPLATWRRTCSPAHRLWPATDVVLAVGTRFKQPQMRWGLDGDIKVIRIDLDPVEITRHARPEVALVADAARGARGAAAADRRGRARRLRAARGGGEGRGAGAVPARAGAATRATSRRSAPNCRMTASMSRI